MCIRLGSVNFELLVINNDDLVCAVLSERISETLNIISEKDCNYLLSESRCKILSFAEQLVGDSADLTVNLLSKDIYVFIFF